MREVRGLLLGPICMGACLLAGCLRATLPPAVPPLPTDTSAHASAASADEAKKQPPLPSDYLVSRPSPVPPEVQPAVVTTKTVESTAEKPIEPVQMHSKAEAPASPVQPPEPPAAHMEVQPAPSTRPDAPSVQVLRNL